MFSFLVHFCMFMHTSYVYCSGGVFLNNFELAKLIEEDAIQKNLIKSLPCVRKHRRCLAEHIKRRGWQNQRGVNKLLNKGLNITNEKKFIDDVLQLMIADNADVLKNVNDDEFHVSSEYGQPTNKDKHKRKNHRKKSDTRITTRSEILEIPDFLNTFELNDFDMNLFSSHKRSFIEKVPINQHSKNTSLSTNKIVPLQRNATNMTQSTFGNVNQTFLTNHSMVDELSNTATSLSSSTNNTSTATLDYRPGLTYPGTNKFSTNKTMIVNRTIPSNNVTSMTENSTADLPKITTGLFLRNTNLTMPGVSTGNQNNTGTGRNLQFTSKKLKTPSNYSTISDAGKTLTVRNTTAEYSSLAVEHLNLTAAKNKTLDGNHSVSNVSLPNKVTIRNKTARTTNITNDVVNVTSITDEVNDMLQNATYSNETYTKSANNETTGLKRNLETRVHKKRRTSKKRKHGKSKHQKKVNKAFDEQMATLESGWHIEDSSNNIFNQWGEEQEDLPVEKAVSFKKKHYEAVDENIGIRRKHNKSRTHKNKITHNMRHSPLSQQSLYSTWNEMHPLSWNEDADENPYYASPAYNNVELGSSTQMNTPLINAADTPAYQMTEIAQPTASPYQEGTYAAPPQSSSSSASSPSSSSSSTSSSSSSSLSETAPFSSYPQSPSSVFPESSQSPPSYQTSQPVYPSPSSTQYTPSQINPSYTQYYGNYKNLSWTKDIPSGKVKATRVCKPGPPRPAIPGKANCLIIGDSIALSYSYSVAAALKDVCQVQLAPASKAGVALDTSYGIQCLNMFMSTSSLTPTHYDVVVMNYGLHDIDYLERYPEEYNNITMYKKNLRKLKRRILRTGADLIYPLSTPVTFSEEKDAILRKYNRAAKKVMSQKPNVTIIDLHSFVTKECGPAPFENCYMMKKPNDVHYGAVGSIMLGKRLAYAVQMLLEKRRQKGKGMMPLPKKIIDLSQNSTQCATPGGSCPAGYTCMNNVVARAGFGCCHLNEGVDCGDSWHCCPKGTTCHPGCIDTQCSCISSDPS